MEKLNKLFIGLTLSFYFLGFAQQTPAPIQTEAISIVGATAHLGNGSVIENCTLIFEKGIISAIGDNNIPTKGKIISAKGKHVYPGFIAPAKSLGLIEVNAVRASNDQDELGDYIPNIRSIIAYNSESKVVESLRPNGVLLGQIAPRGGTISGTSSIVQFDAWNWEDAILKADDGVHLNWPNNFRRGRWWMGEDRGWSPDKDYIKNIDKLKEFITNAKAYGKSETTIQNEAYKNMLGLFSGSQKLYIYAQGEKEMIDAVVITKELGIKHIVIVGGYQAHKIIPFLMEHQVPVLVRHPHTLPVMSDDDYDLPYKLPKLLVDGGLLVGIQNTETSNFQTRNLPFYAGQIVGQGMDKETALQLISLNVAKILGIDKEYGSLEIGKSATLFISEGDALDMRTNLLTNAFIDGREISLETHQTELWQRYTEKYNRK